MSNIPNLKSFRRKLVARLDGTLSKAPRTRVAPSDKGLGKRPSRRLGVLVDPALCELCQRFVGFLFLGKGCL